MKKCYVLFLIFLFIMFSKDVSLAATVGNPLDLDVPSMSAVLRQEIVKRTLDEYEQIVKIKASLDVEFLFGKDLHTTSEVDGAELSGEWYMIKIGTTIFNKIEPYIKLGTANLKADWKQHGTYDIEVVADSGFALGWGIKGIIAEVEDWGVRLTGDFQYRTAELDVSEISWGNTGIIDSGADFDIEEWQTSFILSKKFELPLKSKNIYIVPYTGFNYSDSNVDVRFTNPSDTMQHWTLYEANNDSKLGFVLGCDIMPNLISSFIYSLELRFMNEFALSLGGATKF